MAFNPVANYSQGFQVGQQQAQQQRLSQIQGLQDKLLGQAQGGGFNPLESADFEQLSIMAPDMAARVRGNFEALSEDRKKIYHEDLQKGLRYLEAGDGEGFLMSMQARLKAVEKLGGDPTGVKMLLSKFNEGDIQGLVTGLRMTEQAGIDGGYLGGADQRLTPWQKDWKQKTENLSEADKAKALRIALRLDPGAVGSAAQTVAQNEALTDAVADSQATIEGAKEESKLDAQYKMKPKIAKAVELATSEANAMADKNKETKSNANALKVYDVAFSSLTGALGKTYTGPMAGLMPAITSNAQMAEGAIAMVLPTMKAVFRDAGEGTFTEGDQKLLTDMIPTRSDTPETIKFKLNAIDSIIRAKLGGDGNATSTSTAPTTASIYEKYGIK